MRVAPLILLAATACAFERPEAAPLPPHDAGVYQDAAIEDVAIEDAAIEDAAIEDAAIEDAAIEDAAEPVDAGGDPRCVFNTTTRAIDPRAPLAASRLADLEACIQATPANATALADAFLEEHRLYGSTAPLDNGATRTVLYRGDATNLTVSGSFDNWPSPGTRSFRQIASTDLYAADVPVAAEAREQYKLTRNLGDHVEWTTDPINRWVAWDGFDAGGPGQFNNELVGAQHNFTKSTLYRFFIRDRDVFLQLPIAHYTTTDTMGVLYVHDGNEMLTRSDMQTVADETIAAGRCAPLAIAYIALPNQNIRFDEYTYDAPTANGDHYIAMIADEIVPEIEPHVRTGAMPELRGLAGASLGGLISFYGGWTRNDVFHLIGGQSSSLFWNNEDMIVRFRDQPMINARIYLDSGSPNDNADVTRAMADVLEARGYDYLHVEEANAQHDWQYWRGRFDELLEFLY